ncbi:MAG TPA: hypothetical protein VHC22_10145 [Pirellulales bacterium]|nr:hypothetical protein [Pirellulales bacterium]
MAVFKEISPVARPAIRRASGAPVAGTTPAEALVDAATPDFATLEALPAVFGALVLALAVPDAVAPDATAAGDEFSLAASGAGGA